MEEKNKMICDLETGICGDGDSVAIGFIDLTEPKNKEVIENDCDDSKIN